MTWGRAARGLARLIGPAVLVWLLATTDVAAIGRALAGAAPGPFLAGLVVVLGGVVAKGARWMLLAGRLLPGCDPRDLAAAYARSVLYGVATPGRLGEVVRGAPLLAAGHGPSVAVGLVALDRLYDVAALGIVGAGAVAAVAGPLDEGAPLRAAAGAGGAAVACVAGAWALAGAAARVGGGGAGRTAALAGLVAGWRRLGAAVHGALALWTAASWAVTYVACWLMARCVALPISYLWTAGASALASLVSLLPVTVLGAGTRDATLVVVLGRIGVGPEGAVALSTLLLAITVWSGVACWPAALALGRRGDRLGTAPGPGRT